jgi:ribosome-associated translation inhibitor RaiA
MWNIELRSWNVPLSDALREHTERRLDFALRRFAHRIERVTVRLVDINGPKGGLDKRCRIVVELSPARSLVVEATDSDAYSAVSQAAARADETVARAVTRRRPRPIATRHGGARLAREHARLDAVEAAAEAAAR